MSEQTSTVETIEADSQDALVSVKDMEVYFPVTAGLLIQHNRKSNPPAQSTYRRKCRV